MKYPEGCGIVELITVIVPVYNAEQYLDRCVQSIVDQTYSNLEIILVDDGSPDKCGLMCDAWAKKDSRIKVIHKRNGGGGEARNMALDIAQGDFIAFVDSDDYISPYMLTHLYGQMSPDIDIAECNFTSVYNDGETFGYPEPFEYRVYSSQDAMSCHIADKIFRQVIWNKLYRRRVIADIRFPVGTGIDDEFWTYRVLANATKLVHSSYCAYAYRQQPDSVMHLGFGPTRLQALEAKCQRVDFLKEYFPELVKIANVNLWYTSLYIGQMALLHMTRDDRMATFERIRAVREAYPLTWEDIHSLPMKQKIWAVLSYKSFIVVCRLRNALKIGI